MGSGGRSVYFSRNIESPYQLTVVFVCLDRVFQPSHCLSLGGSRSVGYLLCIAYMLHLKTPVTNK